MSLADIHLFLCEIYGFNWILSQIIPFFTAFYKIGILFVDTILNYKFLILNKRNA